MKIKTLTLLTQGAACLERVVLEWTAELFGFDKNQFGGCLLSGGSMANSTALATARDAAQLKARDYEKNVVYVSHDTHYCVEKGLRFVGLADCIVRFIDVDKDRRMRTDHLRKQMLEDHVKVRYFS